MPALVNIRTVATPWCSRSTTIACGFNPLMGPPNAHHVFEGGRWRPNLPASRPPSSESEVSARVADAPPWSTCDSAGRLRLGRTGATRRNGWDSEKRVGVGGSGGEADDAPRPVDRAAGVPDPVVEATGAALPQLDHERRQAPAAPERGAGDLVDGGEGRLELGHPGLQRGPVGQWLGLRRGPRADLRASWPCGEVLVALDVGRVPDGADHTQLAVQLQPREQHRGLARRLELGALGRLVVGEEHEAALIGATRQEVAALREAMRVDGAEDEGMRFGAPCRDSFAVPAVPLLDGVGEDIGDVETGSLVLLADAGEVAHPMTVAPRMYPCSAGGMATVPSGWRNTSMIAAHTRGTASADPFSVLAICVPRWPATL